ncbi:uncharacterized protein BT62DRAFT_999597 [Guyanagaster necrorhizus]|uniref:Uncharacterized protein n=1 Tax=Guyanagaster necrorhizus TaxID=856835 RepID=A0A9P8AY44_9AGAR|nr:uncharacterized protein BT62DRAFT_999597 [Guyanagaster necrorhizus MCA 3950]KAG7451866.1 hypothetical protein BT62DRAFT_999597 [Guyanagaster necrorhizus MCA 3950]
MSYGRTSTPKVPIAAPINPITIASITPGDNEGKPPLNGIYIVVVTLAARTSQSRSPSSPFASKIRSIRLCGPVKTYHPPLATKRFTPIALQSSVNKHVLDEQGYTPLSGSRNSIKQFAGTFEKHMIDKLFDQEEWPGEDPDQSPFSDVRSEASTLCSFRGIPLQICNEASTSGVKHFKISKSSKPEIVFGV